jgi:hypothetical protein
VIHITLSPALASHNRHISKQTAASRIGKTTMGYYTKFELEGVEPAWRHDTIKRAIIEQCRYDADIITDHEPVKWYKCESDCKAVSAANPGIGFRISGMGEETGDVWWKEFLNGQLGGKKSRPSEV